MAFDAVAISTRRATNDGVRKLKFSVVLTTRHQFLTHWGSVTRICVSKWQSFVRVPCRLSVAKPLPETVLINCRWDPYEQISVIFETWYLCITFFQENEFENVVCKISSFCSGLDLAVAGELTRHVRFEKRWRNVNGLNGLTLIFYGLTHCPLGDAVVILN